MRPVVCVVLRSRRLVACASSLGSRHRRDGRRHIGPTLWARGHARMSSGCVQVSILLTYITSRRAEPRRRCAVTSSRWRPRWVRPIHTVRDFALEATASRPRHLLHPACAQFDPQQPQITCKKSSPACSNQSTGPVRPVWMSTSAPPADARRTRQQHRCDDTRGFIHPGTHNPQPALTTTTPRRRRRGSSSDAPTPRAEASL